MTNFKINNKADVAEIDIIGDIGSSWFSEGVTMDAVRGQLQEIKGKPLTINISSLGGDVNHAFAIYDMIRMHNGEVNINIIGFTASAGTIIAMAGDNIFMSNNAFFLAHNAWTTMQGNAKELRESAEFLDKVDNTLANIYQKKINANGKNKKKSEILSLMAEEKWIDATEAIAWGFVNSKMNDKRVIENSIRNKINNTNYLPKIEQMEEQKQGFKAKVYDFLGIDNSSDVEEVKAYEALEELQAKHEDAVNAKTEEIITLNKEVEDVKAELEAAKEADKSEELNAKIEELNASIEEKDSLFANAETKFADLEKQYNELKAQKTEVKAEGDPGLSSVKIEKTASQKGALEAIAGMEGLARLYAKKD